MDHEEFNEMSVDVEASRFHSSLSLRRVLFHAVFGATQMTSNLPLVEILAPTQNAREEVR